ncbi:hypothetical protein [Saccharolobus shibatae]|uniref:Uncharacterized protein n=1 Tax=Saccharolobus shibatae TaxID=2286 RepID=A0A8F5C0M1_9CREN|nr:hypothetical protein [Saccharolobus shibatae]QXJ34944.1 hypothetical protein J5U22_01491 [Saccharolobus shibatae]
MADDIVYRTLGELLSNYVKTLLEKSGQGKRLSEQEYLILMNYYNSKNMDYVFTELRNIRNELRGIMEIIDRKSKEAMDYADKSRKEAMEYAEKNKKEIIDYVDKTKKEMLDYVDKRFEAVDKRFEAIDKRFDDLNMRIDDLRELILMLAKKT